MYTAKIFDKSFDAGVLRVQVEFSDGTNTIYESCIPQDEGGLKYWVKSRLDQLNFASVIDTKLPVGATIDTAPEVVPPPVFTPEELARDAWLNNYRKWVKIKSTLIDTGILTGDEQKLVQLKAKVTSDFLPAYLDNI